MSKCFFSSNDGVISSCTSAFEIDPVTYLQGLKEIADYLEMENASSSITDGSSQDSTSEVGNASRSITDGSGQESIEELGDPPTSPRRY